MVIEMAFFFFLSSNQSFCFSKSDVFKYYIFKGVAVCDLLKCAVCITWMQHAGGSPSCCTTEAGHPDCEAERLCEKGD